MKSAMKIEKTATGFKLGKGKVVNTPQKAAALFGSMPKSDARKLRKELSAMGLARFAVVPRDAVAA
jgi:hypothetical protein